MRTFLRFFFRLLYHPFAFTYDLVAATVSFGRWKGWILEALPFLSGTRVLELGHGPGHLQRVLLSRKLVAVGLDESRQMGLLARRNTDGSACLARGLAQQLPFASASFDTIISTFPAEYIFDPKTLIEAHRVITDIGRFVILPGAVITGRGVWDQFMAWVFRFTGQTPPDLSEIIHERSKEPFANAGFQLEIHELDVKSSIVFIMVATKSLGHG
jgi:ubiquinone/menaquinone biosynthesis C-methylase UbiE